ncbi:RcnB family protein [Zavarzinia aquatilis]|uniref:RcnB family protein n=1 Tax=Zavarzinia aquatilis TaxID=2211142 RepID=UPI0014032979|nr:RcnB family protein [Zavarzinia aquatilis]
MPKKTISILALALALSAPLAAQAQAPQGGPGQPPMAQDRQGGHDDGQRQGGQQQGGQHRDDAKRGGDHAGKPASASRHHSVTVNDDHRSRARQWFDGHPGWSKPLPSDLRGGVAVGGHLPSGHYQRPPTVIVDLLPRPPAGHAYFTVGTDVVLAVIATGVIAQIVLSAP